MSVDVGPSTLAGLLTAVTAFAGAVIAFVVPNPGVQQQLGTIVSAAVGLVALVVVMVGRYSQAHAKIKALALQTPEFQLPPPAIDMTISPTTVGDQTTLTPQYTP